MKAEGNGVKDVYSRTKAHERFTPQILVLKREHVVVHKAYTIKAKLRSRVRRVRDIRIDCSSKHIDPSHKLRPLLLSLSFKSPGTSATYYLRKKAMMGMRFSCLNLRKRRKMKQEARKLGYLIHVALFILLVI